ncbi:hypothetical protein CHS0354_035910 [Potamilus streckersoni]|uniref:Uncharacterized protein n=1 Tax=Potamilus streckersoni TaxID=2493646 RepID=A0AAE0SFQ8_9BIVA|nr:hypothetical protein CHS0354_035910 [Potamilus streckersoni]
MVVMQMPVWISILFTFIGTTQGEILNATACFTNPVCNMYDLQCPNSHMIRLITAEYRYKLNENCTITSCNNTDSCCYFNELDCNSKYTQFHAQTMYQKCSGKQTCVSIQGEQGNFYNCSKVYNADRRYIHVKYTCIKDTKVIDMCYSPTKMNLSEVNIILSNNIRSTNVASECKCFVESQGNVTYQLVDIRFFTLTEGSRNYTCTSGSLTVDGSSIKCSSDNNKFIYEGSDKFSGEILGNSELKLTDLKHDIPAMVWIYLMASRERFTIHCVERSITTSPTVTTSASDSGKSVDGNSSPAIIGVIISAIIVILVVSVALIILKRRQKKHTKEDTQISHLPNGLANDPYETFTEAGKISAVIETSNYDIINDEQELTYSLPGKKQKDTAKIPERTMKYDNVSDQDYEKIEFEMKGGIKSFNYDTLPTVQEKTVDNPYSHASIQIKSATTGRGAACEYSHCNLNSKDTLKNVDDYSHVDHEKDSKKNPEASNNEADSYNHIDLDDNTHPMRDAKAV